MIAATLGLWAFLLAFIVSNATNRFDARWALMVDEANAIGTTHLRAGYLAEPYASERRQLLQDYVVQRLGLVDLNTYAASRRTRKTSRGDYGRLPSRKL